MQSVSCIATCVCPLNNVALCDHGLLSLLIEGEGGHHIIIILASMINKVKRGVLISQCTWCHVSWASDDGLQ